MPILIMTVGLPRSGKSGWAKSQYMPIVNLDSIRWSIHQQPFLPESEPLVLAHAIVMIRSLFNAGHQSVILDATNITKARRDAFKANDWIVRYKVFDAPMELCISRAIASKREHLIPVIRRMHAEYEPLGEDDKLISVKVCRETDARS